jgi:hypothetical protein
MKRPVTAPYTPICSPLSSGGRCTPCSTAWDVLGLPNLYTFGALALFDCAGTRLMLSQEGSAAKESILYLRVPDIAAAHTELTARGVKFTHAPHLIHRHIDGTEEWMTFFEDPDAGRWH